MSVSTMTPPATKATRVVSAQLADHPVPSGREEDWRFTPTSRLRPLLDGQPADGEPDVSWQADGASVATVRRDDPAFGAVLTPADRASAVAYERAGSVLAARIPREATGASALVALRGTGGVQYTHVLIEAGAHASGLVVLDHTGAGTVGGNVEIAVGDGADLTVVSIQDWDEGSSHVLAHAALIGRDARLRHVVVSLGGDLVRVTTSVRYAGPGGEANLLGVCFADAGQHLEHRLLVDHAVPHCRSDVLYKGALQGAKARTVWVGDVLIRASAVGTSTYEMNRNLLLTDGARADSVPNLEIETGEIVGAGHASATGRFDDEQLFYLQARGIPENVARRLVVHGFFADIIARIGDDGLRDRLLRNVDDRLGRFGPDPAAAAGDDRPDPLTD
ncbi:MAG: Fe-S cluster assembly protein SufD [Actinomycetota bacterium]|nr:MAG: Fe-S cluster assembly protein SufD [Actinomycetota bacterium]